MKKLYIMIFILSILNISICNVKAEEKNICSDQDIFELSNQCSPKTVSLNGTPKKTEIPKKEDQCEDDEDECTPIDYDIFIIIDDSTSIQRDDDNKTGSKTGPTAIGDALDYILTQYKKAGGNNKIKYNFFTGTNNRNLTKKNIEDIKELKHYKASTYTMAGLKKAYDYFKKYRSPQSQDSCSKNIPMLIMITDGMPTKHVDFNNNPSIIDTTPLSKWDGAGGTSSNEDRNNTINFMKYIKNNMCSGFKFITIGVGELYKDDDSSKQAKEVLSNGTLYIEGKKDFTKLKETIEEKIKQIIDPDELGPSITTEETVNEYDNCQSGSFVENVSIKQNKLSKILKKKKGDIYTEDKNGKIIFYDADGNEISGDLTAKLTVDYIYFMTELIFNPGNLPDLNKFDKPIPTGTSFKLENIKVINKIGWRYARLSEDPESDWNYNYNAVIYKLQSSTNFYVKKGKSYKKVNIELNYSELNPDESLDTNVGSHIRDELTNTNQLSIKTIDSNDKNKEVVLPADYETTCTAEYKNVTCENTIIKVHDSYVNTAGVIKYYKEGELPENGFDSTNKTNSYFIPLDYKDNTFNVEIDSSKFPIIGELSDSPIICPIPVTNEIFPPPTKNKYPKYRYRSIDVDDPFPKASNLNDYPLNWREWYCGNDPSCKPMNKSNQLRISNTYLTYPEGYFYKIALNNESVNIIKSDQTKYSSLENINKNGMSNLLQKLGSSVEYGSTTNSFCGIGKWAETCDKIN